MQASGNGLLSVRTEVSTCASLADAMVSLQCAAMAETSCWEGSLHRRTTRAHFSRPANVGTYGYFGSVTMH